MLLCAVMPCGPAVDGASAGGTTYGLASAIAGTLTPALAWLSWNVMAPSPELAVTMFQ
jgi:hypothetical protein